MLSVYVAAVQAGKQKANGTPSRFSARTDIKNVKLGLQSSLMDVFTLGAIF